MLSGLDHWSRGLLAEGPAVPRRALVYRWLLMPCIVGATLISMIHTLPELPPNLVWWSNLAEQAGLAFMTFDYALRLRLAWTMGDDWHERWASLGRYGLSAYGIFDFMAVVPFLFGEAVGLPHDAETVFGLIRFLKLARYSPALETLGAVVLTEMRPLLGSLFIMILLSIFGAAVLYFAERDINSAFASVPQSLWWAIVTLTTLGYGDVVPITPLGKMLGSAVAVLGLCMFALPASILATGFAEEMRRHDFVVNWHLVARVPFFSRLQASQIAEIAALLKPYRAVRGEVLVREGDIGDCMYFLVSGQVEGLGRGGLAFMLKAGEFFGEIALLQRCPRTATIKAASRCQLLVLESRGFERFVAGYPDLMTRIWEVARQRMGQPEPPHDDANGKPEGRVFEDVS
jgi:voltage-gated potassium channel